VEESIIIIIINNKIIVVNNGTTILLIGNNLLKDTTFLYSTENNSFIDNILRYSIALYIHITMEPIKPRMYHNIRHRLALLILIFLNLLYVLSAAPADPIKKYFEPTNWLGTEFQSENGVAVLSASSFETAISIDNAGWLIEFYAPWCGHCQRLRPLYEAVAKQIQSDSDIRVGVAKVDATIEKALASRFPLKGYPTIFFIKDGAVRIYDGKRNQEDFIEFVTEKYKKTSTLNMFESPLGAIGRAKGLVITCGVSIAGFYDLLVDPNGYKFEPWQAIGIICAGGMVASFLLGLFLAWLFRLTDPNPHPHLD
jgi:protein disulfide-isomerase-like protein